MTTSGQQSLPLVDQATLFAQSQQAMTMIMSTIMMSVQNQLLPQIDTGYPFADTLIKTGVICSIGYSLLSFQQHGAKWAEGLIGTTCSQAYAYIWPQPQEHQVRVGEVDDTASYHNVYFQAFMWYLSKQQASCDKGRLRIFAGSQQPTDRIMPENGLACEIVHNEKIIKYTIGTDVRWKHVTFTIHDTSAEKILDFLRVTKAEYTASQVAAPTAREWQQRRYENRNNDWSSIGYTYNTKGFDTLVLDADDKEDLETLVSSFLNGENWCKGMGVSWQDGILLSGPPGMGKTSIIKAVSYKMRRDVYVLDLSTVKDNDQLRILFQNLPSSAFVVLEDVDCMTDAVHNRDDSDYKARMESTRQLRERVVVARALGTAVRRTDTGPQSSQPQSSQPSSAGGQTVQPPDEVDALGISTGITLDCLLNLLDGLSSCHGLFIVMTTNHPERLDPALIRAGRCNLHIKLRACTAKQVDEFFGLFYNKPETEEEHIPVSIMETIPDRVLPPAEVFGFFRRHMYNRKRALEKLPEFIEEQLEKSRTITQRVITRTISHLHIPQLHASPALTADPATATSPVSADALTELTMSSVARRVANAAAIAANKRTVSDPSHGTVSPAPPPPPLIKPWKLPPAARQAYAATADKSLLTRAFSGASLAITDMT